jgi:hypothetical protein
MSEIIKVRTVFLRFHSNDDGSATPVFAAEMVRGFLTMVAAAATCQTHCCTPFHSDLPTAKQAAGLNRH